MIRRHDRPAWWWTLALPLLLVLGCHGRRGSAAPEGDDPRAWEKALVAHLRQHPDDVGAARDLGLVRWLHLGRSGDEARKDLAGAVKAGDPWARVALMVLAESRLETKLARDTGYDLVRAAAAAPEGPDRWLHLAAAEVAVRRLNVLHGEHPDDDARFVALFDGLDLARLSPPAKQGLLSTRASIARTAGQPYVQYYAQQGCVQQWEVGPVEGDQADLELAKPRGAFTVDPTARAVELACVVRLWNPTVRAGIRRMRSTLVVPGDAMLLEISAEEAVRVHVDGELVHRTDRTDRFPANRTVLRLAVTPGEHTVEVATVIPRDRSWVLVRATTPEGEPLVAHARAAAGDAKPPSSVAVVASPWAEPRDPVAGPIHAPLVLVLGLDEAIANGDVDAAETRRDALAKWDRSSAVHLAIAQFERFDPSRGRTVSLSREQAALARAVDRDPKTAAARLRQYELRLERGEHAEVIEELDDPKTSVPGVRGDLLRARAYLQASDERRCDDVLAAALARSPGNCRVLAMQRTRARDKDDVRREDALTAELARCPGSLEIRAGLAQRRGRYEEADALWREALARVPDDLDTLEELARLQVVRGDIAGATATLDAILQRNPLRAAAQVVLADLAAASDDTAAARKQFERALARFPHADALHQGARLLGIPDDLEALRVDGLVAVDDYRKSGKTYDGVTEVLVLDRSAARVYGNGGQRQIVHLVVHLLSKAALDRYGEIEIPQGARLLTLRSIKPDGTPVEAEIVPGKEGIELRDLAIGDFVEYEFAIEREPASALPGYVDVSTFRFRSVDIPYHRTELVVVHPAAMPIREDVRKGAPQPKLETKGTGADALVTRTYRMREVERLGAEPGSRALLDELPNVRVYTKLDVPAYLDGLAVQIRNGQRSNVELRRQVKRIVGTRTDRREILAALWTWVVENIEDAGDLGSASTATLAARAGSRLMLLRTMLREAGIHAELWLVRDRFGPAPLPDGHPMLENYDAAMLAVMLPGDRDPTLVLTASKVMPIGYLSPAYEDTDALRLHLDDRDGAAGPVRTPKGKAGLHDSRKWSIDLEIDRDGGAKVKGTITLGGVEAVAWRSALREVDRDRIREVFQQAELGWLRGATLESLEIRDEKRLDRPLVLEFSATGTQYAIAQGGALLMRGNPLPMSTAARMATLPSRKTGLVVQYGPLLEAVLRIKSSAGPLREVPGAVSLSGAFGRYTRKVSKGGVGSDAVTIEVSSQLDPGIVEPTAYPAFVEFARAVEIEEQALLKAGG
jgi:tetratricopeptide (TPR) repeat protein